MYLESNMCILPTSPDTNLTGEQTSCCWKSQHPVWQVRCVKEASHCLPWCISVSFPEPLKNGEFNTIWQLPITVPCSGTAGDFRAWVRASFHAEPKKKKTPSCIILPSFLSLVLKSWLQATFIIVAWSESEKISPERWCNPVAFSVSHKKVLDVQESFSEPLRLCPLAQMRASSERLKV